MTAHTHQWESTPARPGWHCMTCGAERATGPNWPSDLPAHVQHPRTAAGRRLLGKNMGSGDAALIEWLANDIWAIESEAVALAATPAPLDVDELQRVAKIVRRHTHQGTWAMTRFAGPDPEHDCHLCRALVAAGVLTLDQIGAGTRAAIAREYAQSEEAKPTCAHMDADRNSEP